MGGPRGDFYKVVLGPSHLRHSWVKSPDSEFVDKSVNDEETHTCHDYFLLSERAQQK